MMPNASSETWEVDDMSAASPDMAAPELQALRDSIAKLGQLVPIVLYRGKVIDGRKRLLVCQELGREVATVAIPDDAAAADYATGCNLLRTHYTTSQRAMYADALTTLPQGQHPKKPHRTIIQCDEVPVCAGDTEIESPVDVTQKQAGALLGVHADQVRQARNLRRHATPEVIAAVERGDLSVYAGRKIATTPKAEQPAMLARVLAVKGKGKKLPPGTIKPKARTPPRRDTAVVITKCLSNLEATCEMLEQYGAKELPTGPRKAWIASLDTITAALRRFRRRLGGEGNGT